MEIPAELPTADPRTDGELQPNLLQDYERKFEQTRGYPNLCSCAGLKICEKGQCSVTLEEEEERPNDMKNLSREYTLLRYGKASRAREWLIGNTKIGPVLDVKVCLRQRRYGIEILIESLFRDGTASWVRIPFSLRMLSAELQGNLLPKRGHD